MKIENDLTKEPLRASESELFDKPEILSKLKLNCLPLFLCINAVCINYRSGMVNLNTVNSKFHLIRSFFEILARILSFHF